MLNDDQEFVVLLDTSREIGVLEIPPSAKHILRGFGLVLE